MPASTRNRTSVKSSRAEPVGTWALISYAVRDIKTGIEDRPFEDRPFGERPLGFILYTPDGYMSAQLQRPQRSLFLDGELARAAPEEFAAAGSSYIAYPDRFFIDEDENTLSHEMAVSFFPNWQGQRPVRLVEIRGERLQLRTDGPQRVNGELKTATLTWRRAQLN